MRLQFDQALVEALEDRCLLTSHNRHFVPEHAHHNAHRAVPPPAVIVYPLHRRITATEFWVGEPADSDNDDIANAQSAWDDLWEQHFGGVDDPASRNGYLPAAFTPDENPFYFALPYDDFDNNGDRRHDVNHVIPWARATVAGPLQSLCKNRWIQITSGRLVAYAQWEDVGPFRDHDSSYVFGHARPNNAINEHAGLDLSPAATDYLGLNGEQPVNWRFVDASQVPAGPWSQMVTTSQITWL